MEHDAHGMRRACARCARRMSTGRIAAMLEYDFMRNAFAAAAIVAVVAGLVGYFLVLRGQTFAGHALAHVGFTGATGAVLIGVSPLWGLVVVTVAGGIGMGLMGERLAQRDVAIGMVLALALGFGLLFLHFFTASRRRRRRCCSATCWRWIANTAVAAGGLACVEPGRARRHLPAAAVRQPAAGTGRGEGRVSCACTRCCSWRSSRSRRRSARRSSACCWCSR